MSDHEQQLRLQRFWGAAVFSVGIFWGISNLIYLPVAALTSIVGSSWFEVALVIAGGALSFGGSIGAFYNRRLASRLLLAGGAFLLLLAIGWHTLFAGSTRGIPNLLLLFLAGAIAASLGIFGEATERKGWPRLLAGR